MAKLRDLIPKDALDQWDGTAAFVVSAPQDIESEAEITVLLLNELGSSVSVTFDLHEGVVTE